MNQTKDKLLKFAVRLRRWLADDWLEKIVALVLACIVWIVVKDRLSRSKKVTLPEGWNTTRVTETR
jgi:YbbR domain-containing protein